VNNLWHDIAGLNYGGGEFTSTKAAAAFWPRATSFIRTTHGGFHQHYGETNIVRNNIFAFGRDHQIQRSRVEPHISFSFPNQYCLL